MSGIKNFLFDLYGTLLDIETDENSPTFWRAISVEIEKRREDGGQVCAEKIAMQYRFLCDREKKSVGEDGEIDLLKVFENLLALSGCLADADSAARFASAFRAASLRKLSVYPEIPEILSGLKKRGAKLFLLSNAQACFTSSEIEQTGLTAFFDGILLSSEAGQKKPGEKFFMAAFEKFSIAADDCVYVGNDLKDDVAGARRVGMRSVYIRTGQSGCYENAPIPDFTVTDGDFSALRKKLLSLATDV